MTVLVVMALLAVWALCLWSAWQWMQSGDMVGFLLAWWMFHQAGEALVVLLPVLAEALKGGCE